MKRFDLLIQLVKNIYELLKTQSKTSCCCAALPSKNVEAPADREGLSGIVQLLKNIEKQMHLSNELAGNQYSLKLGDRETQELEEWMSKQEVIDYLQISERTYRRQVESGFLKPMNIGGGDFYFKSQLVEALQESRRRGRV